jgi:hypothetical protein
MTASRSAVFLNLEPVVGTLLGLLFLPEMPGELGRVQSGWRRAGIEVLPGVPIRRAEHAADLGQNRLDSG